VVVYRVLNPPFLSLGGYILGSGNAVGILINARGLCTRIETDLSRKITREIVSRVDETKYTAPLPTRAAGIPLPLPLQVSLPCPHNLRLRLFRPRRPLHLSLPILLLIRGPLRYLF
jgi:hypothetical protein